MARVYFQQCQLESVVVGLLAFIASLPVSLAAIVGLTEGSVITPVNKCTQERKMWMNRHTVRQL